MAKISAVKRIAISKILGFVVGLLALLGFIYLWPNGDRRLAWGLLCWYTTFGAFIGLTGLFTWNPIIKMPFPWWLRGSILGAWLNFVLVLFTYDIMHSYQGSLFGYTSVLASPWWIVLEGLVLGGLIDFLATRFAGEGEELSIPTKPH